MRLKSQHAFILAIAVILILFFGLGSLFNNRGANREEVGATPKPAGPQAVQVRLTPETSRPVEIILRGRTEAARTVITRSETAGVVVAAPATEGSFVAKGQILCRLSVDARQAALDQTRAALKSRQLQREAAAQLAEKGFRSQTQVLEAQANLDAAQAGVRQAEIVLNQVNIRAPFAGVFDKRDAEIGTYLAPGQACGTMIELNPLLVVGDAPETEAGKLRVGATAQARLVSGQILTGRVRYVSREADAQTRTYRVEIVAQNPGNSVRSGLSSDLRIEAGSGSAHLVPVSALVLDAAGRQGIRQIVNGDRVAFAPVTVLEETSGGVWVSGLKGSVQIITVGQSFVADGQKVKVAQAR